MAKVITFSRYFPKGHSKEGQPTFFVEAFLKGNRSKVVVPSLQNTFNYDELEIGFAKTHTIRAGKRFKKGDIFSPRVWSGKPYRSPQIGFAPDTLVKQVWDFSIFQDNLTGSTMFSIDGIGYDCDYRPGTHAHYLLFELSTNDGLKLDDFMSWFKYPKPFEGQIISWSGNEGY